MRRLGKLPELWSVEKHKLRTHLQLWGNQVHENKETLKSPAHNRVLHTPCIQIQLPVRTPRRSLKYVPLAVKIN